MAKKSTTKGTLIRGADGALYFVDDGKKWARRLPNEYTKEARVLLGKLGLVAKRGELPAFHGSGLVRRVTAERIDIQLNRLAALGRRRPPPK
jgi:hypothetical protein